MIGLKDHHPTIEIIRLIEACNLYDRCKCEVCQERVRQFRESILYREELTKKKHQQINKHD